MLCALYADKTAEMTAAHSMRLARFGRAAFMAIIIASPVLFLLVILGAHGGMPWDYSLMYVSESSQGFRGFCISGTIFASSPTYSIMSGISTSALIGQDGSFIGYHHHAVLWIAVARSFSCLAHR